MILKHLVLKSRCFKTRYIAARDEGVFRQVQRPDLCQDGKAGHYDPTRLAGQRGASAGRAERVN